MVFKQHVTLLILGGTLWLYGSLDFEPRLAQSQAENMRLLIDTFVKSPCLGGGVGVGGEECGPWPVFALCTLAFTLQLGQSTEKPQSGYLKGA